LVFAEDGSDYADELFFTGGEVVAAFFDFKEERVGGFLVFRGGGEAATFEEVFETCFYQEAFDVFVSYDATWINIESQSS